MPTDSQRWDRKYREQGFGTDLEPDSLLVEFADLFKPSDTVVDLACGTGRHIRFLAKRGCYVVALDCSVEALRRCQSLADESGLTIHGLAADLNAFRFAPQTVDAIVCFNFLNRDISENLCAALKPGGVLVFKTFNRNFIKEQPGFNLQYVLDAGELSQMFGGLEILSLADECHPATQTRSHIVAVKQSQD